MEGRQSNYAAVAVLSAFETLLQATTEDVCAIGTIAKIPSFEKQILIDLCEECTTVLKSEAVMLSLNYPLVIIGDLHGNLHDLVRLIRAARSAQVFHPFLFLGDYVDRGTFSLEVIEFLLALKVLNPERVFLLRGNHEFRNVNQKYGFCDEIISRYGDDELWECFNKVFDYLPLAASVGNTFFCVHGGIAPELTDVNQIYEIKLPLTSYEEDPLVASLVWSDPFDQMANFMPSKRGQGVFYGPKATAKFLKDNNFQKLIRGHECVHRGIDMKFNQKVITVFSSSFYSEEENMAGMLVIDETGKPTPTALMARLFIKRKTAVYGEEIKRKIEHRQIHSFKNHSSDSVRNLVKRGEKTRSSSVIKPIVRATTIVASHMRSRPGSAGGNNLGNLDVVRTLSGPPKPEIKMMEAIRLPKLQQ